MQKDEYINEVSAQVGAARAKLKTLTEQRHDSGGGPDFNAPVGNDAPELQEISESLDMIEGRLDEVRRANEDGWDDARMEIDSNLMWMNRAMKQTLTRVL